MEWINVVSSNIEALSWNAEILNIKFKSGRVYQYTDVPENIFKEMLNAESKGKYFNINIRGKYLFDRIE